MEKMSSRHVEYIGILLVREYLTAKRLVSTLRCMELEFPLKIRHSNMRLLLSRMFNIEDGTSTCSETLNSYQSMLEIIMREFIKTKANPNELECSLQQFETDGCYLSKSVSPELNSFQNSSSRCESGKLKTSSSVTEFENIFETRTSESSIQIRRDTTAINVKKRCDFQNLKKLLNFVAIQGKSKYMNRDEDSLSNEDKLFQCYGVDQPRDYPKQHTQSCLRDREEILMSSLRRSPDYLNNDNSVRLGPSKVNTFQCLKTNVELPSGTDETGKKYERFYRIIPKITKKLSDSSLGTTVQDSDKNVSSESTNQSPTDDTNTSATPYLEQKTVSAEKPRIIIIPDKDDPISEQCVRTSHIEKELVGDDEINMNNHVVDEVDEQLENTESTKITNQTSSKESDDIIMRIPVAKSSDASKESNVIEESPLEKSINSLEIENEDREGIEFDTKNTLERVDQFSSSDDEDVVYEEIETIKFEPITTKLSKKLTKLFSGNESLLDVPSRWKGQSFVFNDSTKLKYGLMQTQGGPCGVIAVVQAFLLKALLFDDKTQAVCQDPFRPTQVELRTGLVQAISEILWQAGKANSAVLAMYESADDDDDNDDGFADEERRKTIICRKFNKLVELQSAIKQELNQFLSSDGNGCYLVAISAILSSGIESVLSDMDESSNSLIVNGGSCSLELVNLLLTGNAVSNVFDNNLHIGACLLKGVSKRSNIGFLSIYEHSNACQVGSNLKTPRYPIWVVNCQNHFTVIYSENKKLISDWRAERQFNIYLYDSISNQKEEVKLTIDTTGLYLKPRSEGEYVPPIELCLLTKWKGAAISWNGSKYM